MDWNLKDVFGYPRLQRSHNERSTVIRSMQIADSSYIFCRLAARKYARIVQKLGFPTKFKDFKIQNMVSFFLSRFRTWYMFFDHYLSIIAYLFTQVGSCDVKFPIRLEGLVLTHSQVKNQWFQKEHFASPFASSLDHLLNHMLNLFNDLLFSFQVTSRSCSPVSSTGELSPFLW